MSNATAASTAPHVVDTDRCCALCDAAPLVGAPTCRACTDGDAARRAPTLPAPPDAAEPHPFASFCLCPACTRSLALFDYPVRAGAPRGWQLQVLAMLDAESAEGDTSDEPAVLAALTSLGLLDAAVAS